MPISFSPDQSVAPGAYQFSLRVKSINHTTTPIYLFAIVDQDGQGHVIIKVSDIYTGTSDGGCNLVVGLPGATIILQNEDTLVS